MIPGKAFKLMIGTLYVLIGDQVRVKFLGDVVDDPEELTALGAARVRELARAGIVTHELETPLDADTLKKLQEPEEVETRSHADEVATACFLSMRNAVAESAARRTALDLEMAAGRAIPGIPPA